MKIRLWNLVICWNWKWNAIWSRLSIVLVLSVFPFFWFIGKPVTSLCWRPDGKAIAVGLEDGTISLHDVEASIDW